MESTATQGASDAEIGPRSRGRVINTSSTRYHVVRAAAVALGWRLWDHDATAKVPQSYHNVPVNTAATSAASRETWEVLWVDKSVLAARVASLRNFQRVNHFPGMNAVGRKATLFRRLMAVLSVSALPTDGTRRASSRTSLPPHVSHDDVTDLAAVVAQFAPRSFLSSRDLVLLERYLVSGAASSSSSTSPPSRAFFIVKPNRGCQGRGIRVTTDPIGALTEAEHTVEEECLIQVYVDRPLLIDGKKFDLRLYVLLVSIAAPCWPSSSRRSVQTRGEEGPDGSAVIPKQEQDPLDGVCLFIHEEGLVRICAEPYAAPTVANCRDASVHLTNYAVNKSSKAFRKPTTAGLTASGPGVTAAPASDDDGNTNDEDDSDEHDGDLDKPGQTTPSAAEETGNKRSLRVMPALIEAATDGRREWQNDVWRRVQECVTLTVLSGLGVLRRGMEESSALRGNKADGRVCFELLGFDVMLRAESCEPVLMEVNHSPSLFCDSAFDFAIKQRVLMDTLRLVETHMGPNVPSKNATRERDYLSTAERRWEAMETAQEGLVTNGKVRYHQLLPRRRCAPEELAPAAAQDWTEAERRRQQTMLTLSSVIK